MVLRTLKALLALTLLVVLGFGASHGSNGTASGSDMSEAAYALLTTRAITNRVQFFIYQTDVHLCTVVTNDIHAPTGGTVLLDNIRFEPVPVSQQNALSCPLSPQTFGVVPRQNPASGRVPMPLDQVLRNLLGLRPAWTE